MVRLVQWLREVDMTPLQLLCLVSCISQDMRYVAQLNNLMEYLCHILKLNASWSKLSNANISIMHALSSPTSSLITGNLGKMTVLMPFRYLIPALQSQCPRNRKWKKNCILNLQLINWHFMLTCSHFKSCNRHMVNLDDGTVHMCGKRELWHCPGNSNKLSFQSSCLKMSKEMLLVVLEKFYVLLFPTDIQNLW